MNAERPDAFAVYGWHMLYVGAFWMLRLKEGAVLMALGDNTRTDDEATRVLEFLRDPAHPDPTIRAFLALKWLQEKRRSEEKLQPS